MARFPVFACLACALALLSCGGLRGHDLQEGRYAFTATEVISDPCGLLPAAGLWGGVLTRSGDYVRIDYDLLQMGLVGYFRYKLEEFYLDGTSEDVQLPAAGGGRICAADQVAIHLTGVLRTLGTFDGSMAVDTYARADESCECSLQVRFQAVRQ